jgi:hypothetical protein
MALAESIEYDKIEIVGQYKAVQVRKATVIKKDGVELTRTYFRYVLHPGTLDASDNLVDTDLSAEPAEISAICTAAWTTDVKAAWKTKLIADKTSENFVSKDF